MPVARITTHNTDALARLLYQYKDSTKLQGLITALFGTQVQELEDALYPLFERLDLDSQEGKQLDGIGSIVGQSRLGLDDDLYRIWIKARIGQNVSEGDIERIISVWKLINSPATTIQLVEHFPAEVALYSDAAIDIVLDLTTEGGADIVAEDDTGIAVNITAYMEYIWAFMQKILSAGVKVAYVAVFDPDNAFGFYGSSHAGGFGDLSNTNAGGELGYIELPL